MASSTNLCAWHLLRAAEPACSCPLRGIAREKKGIRDGVHQIARSDGGGARRSGAGAVLHGASARPPARRLRGLLPALLIAGASVIDGTGAPPLGLVDILGQHNRIKAAPSRPRLPQFDRVALRVVDSGEAADPVPGLLARDLDVRGA